MHLPEDSSNSSLDDQERFRGVVETVNDGIITINSKGDVLTLNPAGEKIFGYSAQETIGCNVKILMPEPYHSEHDQYLKSYMTTGEVKILGIGREVVGKRKNGSTFPMDLAVGEMLVGNERIFVGICRDITERKNAEQALLDRTNQLLAANKELDLFAYSVSHDLRAPLRAMDGFSQALVEDYGDKLDDTAHHYLDRISAASTRMGQMIDNILSLSRATRGEMQLEDTDISLLAKDTIETLRAGEPDRTVEVLIKKRIVARCDPRLIKIVLDNLLGNAWKFTSKTESAKIELGTIKKDSKLAYFIADNGAGFDMAYSNKLFGIFQRLHGANEFEGTGIGLATVSRLITRHGGKVWAESKPGEGATFYFSLGSLEQTDIDGS